MQYMAYAEIYRMYLYYLFLIYGKYIIHQHQKTTPRPPAELVEIEPFS